MSTIDIRQIKIRSNRKRRINNDKVNELRDSIKSIGLINPITLDKDNYLIAGHHRYQALLSLGRKDVPYTVLETDDALLIELAEIDENFVRYELTDLESGDHLKARKEIYEKLYPQTKNGMRNGQTSKNAESAFLETKSFTEDTSEKLNKSKRAIETSIQIATNIAPEVKDMIYDTPLADQKTNLLELSRLEPEKQKQVVEAIKNNPKADVKEHLKQQKKEERIKEEVTQFNDTVVNDDFISIHNIDFREYAKGIPDGSIDLILTDPPYPQEFLPLWGDLSAIAKRILKPNGFLIAYSGQLHLNKVFNYLDENLNYYWTFALRHTGGNQLIHPRNIFCGWKPLLVFQNGLKKVDFQIEDFITGSGREKEFHDWQQSELEIYDIIQRFTKAGDTVFEPFLGGGTTATACIKLKRKIIGCEIVKESFISAKGRIYNEQSK